MKITKKKAWEQFSIYIRLKDADRNGYVTCVTCGTTRHYKDQMQAGHYVDGRNNSVLFDERLVHPQCYYCNCRLKGNKVAYTIFMMDKYKLDRDKIEEYYNMKFQVKKWKAGELEEIYNKYKSEVKHEMEIRSL